MKPLLASSDIFPVPGKKDSELGWGEEEEESSREDGETDKGCEGKSKSSFVYSLN
jgi:hypothetical protein